MLRERALKGRDSAGVVGVEMPFLDSWTLLSTEGCRLDKKDT